MYILGIESSCDETAVAILDQEGNIISESLYSQIDLHKKFGGVVPELASRDHATRIDEIVQDAINKSKLKTEQLSAIAISNGPGLLGCLLVGLSYAKALAMSLNIPLIPVNHVKAHLLTVFMPPNYSPIKAKSTAKLNLPVLAMAVSGGHTSIYLIKDFENIEELANTIDDAAGETFDKVARFVKLPYPGGKELSSIAEKGTASIKFPKPKVSDNKYNFSFSGLKTHIINYLHNNKITKESPELPNILASFEETITSILADRLEELAIKYKINNISIAGGVAANKRLRKKVLDLENKLKANVFIPPIKYCTDNAVMIANYARLIHKTEITTFTKEMLKISAYPTSRRKRKKLKNN